MDLLGSRFISSPSAPASHQSPRIISVAIVFLISSGILNPFAISFTGCRLVGCDSVVSNACHKHWRPIIPPSTAPVRLKVALSIMITGLLIETCARIWSFIAIVAVVGVPVRTISRYFLPHRHRVYRADIRALLGRYSTLAVAMAIE